MPAPLFDTHAHLQDPDFDRDRDELLCQLGEAGVARVVLPASDLEDSARLCRLALQYPILYAVVGCHPHEASSWTPQSAAELRSLIEKTEKEARRLGRQKVIVGIGEIGLDYHYDFSPRETQKAVYREQIELAHSLKLPIVIHEREAFSDSWQILKEAAEEGLLMNRFAVHCYSGSAESVALLLELGDCYFGFDGPITFKNAKRPLEALKAVPRDRLLIETDSPYLTPVPYRGERNDPRRLIEILKKASESLGVSEEELRQDLWSNSCRFFNLPESLSAEERGSAI